MIRSNRQHGMDVTTVTIEAAARIRVDAGRRRFTRAVLIAIAFTAVPFGWILWALWVPLNPLRPSVYQDNFYDLQTRSVLHGHLSLANGALGLEGFAHAGRTDTYFGLFPSIIRHPNCWCPAVWVASSPRHPLLACR